MVLLTKKPEKAIVDITKAIELGPNRSSAYRLRGDVYSRQRLFDKAIADYSKSITLNSNDAIAPLQSWACLEL